MKFKQKNMLLVFLMVVAVTLLASSAVFAQISHVANQDLVQKSGDDTQSLQALAQNPIANAISLPLQYNANFGYGPEDDDMGGLLNIQPVIPFKLNDDWNFIARTIIPVTHMPITNASDAVGLGDIQFQGYFTPAKPGKLIWGVGTVNSFPTATDDMKLGTEQWTMGPAAVLLTTRGQWTFGGLINQQWSIAGEPDRAEVSSMLINPFVNYNLDKGWYLTSSPNFVINWEADDDNMYTVPVGGGIGRAFKIGKQAVNVKLAYYYNVNTPDAGADQQVQFQFTFLFPTN